MNFGRQPEVASHFGIEKMAVIRLKSIMRFLPKVSFLLGLNDELR